MTDLTDAVTRHYTGEAMAERVLAAAEAAGVSEYTAAALAPADEFHIGGLAATRALATLAGVEPGADVLDLGPGLGGPARILAAEYGCRVTGIDLTPEFVRSASVLARACSLDEMVSFEVGDATDLRFPDGAFDLTWSQHVVMNIRDRAAFAASASRVTRAGGTFAFFDILRGDPGPLTYPMPWATDESASFLATVPETDAYLRAAGFEQVTLRDATGDFLPLLPRMIAGAHTPFGLSIVIGPEIAETLGHVHEAASAGRLRFVQGVYRKPA